MPTHSVKQVTARFHEILLIIAHCSEPTMAALLYITH